MSSDHRKPVVAFVALVFIAAALVGIDRADAEGGRLLAAVIGTSVRVQGDLLADASASLGTGTAAGATSAHSAARLDVGQSAEDKRAGGPGTKKAGKKSDKAKVKAARFAAKTDRKAAKAQWLSSRARGKPPWAFQASQHGRSQSALCPGKATDRPLRGHQRGGRGFSGRR